MPTQLPVKLGSMNPNYLISIFGKDENGDPIGTGQDSLSPYMGILAPIPEEFSLEVNSQWHPLLQGVLKNVISRLGAIIGVPGAGAIADAAAGSAGYSLATVQSTQLLWESTTPIVFNLPLKFNAVYDALEEVTKPIEKLLSLVLPSTITSGVVGDNTPLQAPGPCLINNKYSVAVAVGNMFIFEQVIITGVSATFTTLSVDAGDFVYADVNVGIQTSRILTKATLGKAFKNRSQFNTFKSDATVEASQADINAAGASGAGAAP